MKLTTYLESLEQIDLLVEAKVDEAIICPLTLSRFGKVLNNQITKMAQALKEKGIKPILEWDILMTENIFSQTIKSFEYIDLNEFESIRLQDPGAIHYILENYPHLNIQLILESGGHHNIESLKTWKRLVGDRLERVVLSLELSRDHLANYINELGVEVEFLGLGRILLFYTPRNLISPIFGHDESDSKVISDVRNSEGIEVSASSEESPHKGFPVIENMHGTFMFNTKDHCVLEYLDDLQKIGLSSLRIDLRFGHDLKMLGTIRKLMNSFDEEVVNRLKENYPVTLIRGFFHKNKSDVLFKKLKNYRIQRSDDSFLGDVIEVNKKNHLGIILRSRKNSLKLGMRIRLLTPDGKDKELFISSIKTSDHQEISEATHGQVVFVPHVSGVSVKTVAYLMEG